MAIIVVRCPKTREAILPGIDIGAAEFGSIPSANRAKCPICGEKHAWLPYAARMVEALTASIRKAPPMVPSSDKLAIAATSKDKADVES